MKSAIFKGCGVAIITPMNPDGSFNYEKLKELIDFQINNGTDSIIICGTTGESATMTHREHIDIIKFTVDYVGGRIPVVAGAGSNETVIAAEFALEAEKAGADGLLIVTPYYNKTSQAGLIAHFSYIADRTNLPIILYNVPSRTGLTIKPETYAVLCKHKNIVATKEACGDISAIAKIAALCGDELDIYTGNDDQLIPFLSLGGIGVISVAANIIPKQMHDICQLYFDGKTKESLKLHLEYLDLMNDLFLDVNPIPVKEAMNLMGFEVGNCRLPLVPMSESAKNALINTLEKHSLVK